MILMGLSCFSAQVLFIRGFMIQFQGNELIIGIVLANWLLIEALGSFMFAFIAKRLRSPLKLYALTQLLVFFLLPAGIIASRCTKVIFHMPLGVGQDIASIFFSSLTVMFLLGITLGGQFPLISRIHKDIFKKNLYASTSSSYFLEAIGFVIGGIFITVIIGQIKALHISFIIAALNLSSACLIMVCLEARSTFKKTALVFSTIAVCISLFFISPILEKTSLLWQWQDINLVESRNSVYGNVAVTRQDEQYSFYYDGLPFMSVPTPDISFLQDLVHFSMSSIHNHENVAVLGSGLGGIISNVLQYPVRSVDYAELDPLVIKMARKYTTNITQNELQDPRVNVHHKEGRLFLKQSARSYSAIIMNLPPPSTLIINRLYTKEFFALVKNHLSSNGIFCFSLPGSLSYLSNEQIDINKCILKTLKTCFKSVSIIPGHYNIFIASNNPDFTLSPKTILEQIEKHNISTALFNEFYVRDKLNAEKQQWFYESLERRSVHTNRDLKPSAVLYGLSLWNALFSPGFKQFFQNITRRDFIALAISCILMIFFIHILIAKRRKQRSTAYGIIPLVLISGLTGVSLNLILLLCLQTFYGYIYLHVGILISSFMLGLSFGGYTISRSIEKIRNINNFLLKIDLSYITLCLLVFGLIYGIQFLVAKNTPFWIVLMLLIFASFSAGMFVGLEFPLANKIYLSGNTKARNILYAVDMLGSFIGAITVSVILIPALGIPLCVLVLFIIKLTGFYAFKLLSRS